MQKYKQRLLHKAEGRGMPSRVFYIDTETKQQAHEPETWHRMKLAWTCYAEYDTKGRCLKADWQRWFDSIKLWEHLNCLIHSGGLIYVVAHNIYFDLQSSDFIYYFTNKGWELDFYYDKGLVYVLSLKRKNLKMRCISTTNFYDFSLEALGEMLGKPKLKVDFKRVSLKRLSEYCHNDVEIMKEALEYYFQFLINHDLGKFRNTKSSQALEAYKHRFMESKVYIHHFKPVKELERVAYFGGRVECFHIGKVPRGPFCTVDVNSMYPFIMQRIEVPYQFVAYFQKYAVRALGDLLRTFCAVARVTVSTEQPLYAVRFKNKLVFPVGRFETYLCTESLKEALKRGHIREVKEIAVYRKALLFKEYVDFFYNLKVEYTRENNKIMRELTKKFLNSLYGKFAQTAPLYQIETHIKENTYFRAECFDLDKGLSGMEYKMFHKHIIELGKTDSDDAICTISAHITDAARLLLWKYIEILGYHNLLYCDTDSLKFRSKHIGRLKPYIDPERLGFLKFEGEFKEFTIYGPKSYITEKGRTLKGIPSKAIEIEPGLFQFEAFSGQSKHMREQVTRYFITTKVTRSLNMNYDKGVITPSGRVKPYRL